MLAKSVKQQLRHQVATVIEVVEGRVFRKLDRAWRRLEDGLVRRRVHVEVDETRPLDERPHQRAKFVLLLLRVDGVKVEGR